MSKENKGLFGLPIRPVETEEELERLLNPKKKTNEEEPKNFTYIPKLNLLVADSVSMLGKSWYDCKIELENKGSRMLTPAEFWVYYKFCMDEKPSILKNSIEDIWQSEWMDALVKNKTDLIVNPSVNINSLNEYYHEGGKLYQEVVLQEKGRFDIGDAANETGLPYTLNKSGKFGYISDALFYDKLVAVQKDIKMNDLDEKVLVLYLKYGPNVTLKSAGVREVKIDNDQNKRRLDGIGADCVR